MDLEWLLTGGSVLLVRDAAGKALVVYDAHLRPRLELLSQTNSAYTRRAAQEYAGQGLLVKEMGEPFPNKKSTVAIACLRSIARPCDE